MFKKKIKKNDLLYKPYLLYNLYLHHKCFIKRNTYSQSGEDLFINSFFENKQSGFYVDIGCFHPILYSNTARLYNRGWKGINIDINQTSIDLFNIVRKRDKNYCAAISNQSKNVFSYIDNNFSPINSINKNFFDITSSRFSEGNYIKKEIKAFKFLDLLKNKNIEINFVDFLNIDAEGHDFEILEGIDLDKIKIKLICIEMYDETSKVNKIKFIKHLEYFGYNHIKSIGDNGFFEKID